MNNNNVTDEGVSAPPPPTDSVTAINMNITDLRSIAALSDPSVTAHILSLNLHMNNVEVVDFNVFASPERHHASQVPNAPSTPADAARQASAQTVAVNVGQVMVPALPRPLPFSALVELNLSANCTTALHGFALLASLRKLNISGNGITAAALADVSFQSCPLMWRSLRHLDLSHNVISSLEHLGCVSYTDTVASDAKDATESRSPRNAQHMRTQSAERLKPKPARASAFGRTIDAGATTTVPTGPTDSTATAAPPTVTMPIALEWLDLSGNHLSAVEAIAVLQQCSKLTVLQIAPKLVRGSTSPPAAASRGVSSSAPTTRVQSQSYRQETSPRTRDRLSDERPDRTPSRREAVDSAVTDGSPGSAYDADPFAVLDRSDPFASAPPDVETPRQLPSGREGSGEMGNGLESSESPSPRLDGARGAEEQVRPQEVGAGLRSDWTWAAESFAVLQRSANRHNTASASERSPRDPMSGERDRAGQQQRSPDHNAVTRSPLYFHDVVALLPQLWILDGRMTSFDTQHPAPVGSLAPPALRADIVRSSAEFPLLSAWVTAARAEAATHRAESEEAIRRALIGPPDEEGIANSQNSQQRQRQTGRSLNHEQVSAVRSGATDVHPPRPRDAVTMDDESDERPNPLLDTLAPRQVPHRHQHHQASADAPFADGVTTSHEVSSVVAASTIAPDDGTVGAVMPAADVSSETPPSSSSHRSVNSADVAREENYLLKQLLEQLLQERANHQLRLQQPVAKEEQQRSATGEEKVTSCENPRMSENATQTTTATEAAASSSPLHHSSRHPPTTEDGAGKKTCQRCSDTHVAMERWRSEALSAIAALRDAEAEAEHLRDAGVAAEHAHRRETDQLQRDFAELTKVREAAHAAATAAESEKHAATLRQHEQNVASRIADACAAVRLEMSADESTLAEKHSSRLKEEQSRFLEARAAWKGQEERITVQNDELRKDALTWQQEVVRLSQTLQSSQALSEERAADAHKYAAQARDLQSTVDDQRVTISTLNHELQEAQFTSASLQERLMAAEHAIDAKIKVAMEGVVKSERAAAARSARTTGEQLRLKTQECFDQRSEIDVLRAQLADRQAAHERFASSSATEVRRLRETVRLLETEAVSALLHRDQETARKSVVEEESSARVALMLQVIQPVSHRPDVLPERDAHTVALASGAAPAAAPSEQQQRQAELVLALSNENADLRRASVDHHETLAALQRTVANLKESLERRDGEVAAVEDEAWVKIDEKRKENAALESELSDLKRHNERLVTELRDTAALLRKTTEEVQSQHAVADASAKMADEHLRERDRAVETLRDREARLQRSEDHRQCLESSVRTMLNDREEAACFFREWKRQQAVTEEALAAKTQELTALKSKIRTISSDD